MFGVLRASVRGSISRIADLVSKNLLKMNTFRSGTDNANICPTSRQLEKKLGEELDANVACENVIVY